MPAHQRDWDIVPYQKEHESLIRKIAGSTPLVVLTQEEYDALDVPDPETLYVIVG